MSSSKFLCNGKYYIISKSFSNILESTGESFTDIKKSEKEYSTRKQKTDTLRLQKSQEELEALKDKLDAAQNPDEQALIKKQMSDKSDEIKKWKADVAADKSRNV